MPPAFNLSQDQTLQFNTCLKLTLNGIEVNFTSVSVFCTYSSKAPVTQHPTFAGTWRLHLLTPTLIGCKLLKNFSLHHRFTPQHRFVCSAVISEDSNYDAFMMPLSTPCRISTLQSMRTDRGSHTHCTPTLNALICTPCGLQKQMPPHSLEPGGTWNRSLTMTYFHTGIRTIIGAEAFHCPVRDGKEWDHLAMVVRHNLLPGWGCPAGPICRVESGLMN
jgi:hypothetical protein